MLKKIDASNKNMKETTLKFFGSFVKELKEFKYINLLLNYELILFWFFPAQTLRNDLNINNIFN